jgi:hypothetical protein
MMGGLSEAFYAGSLRSLSAELTQRKLSIAMRTLSVCVLPLVSHFENETDIIEI